MRVRLGNLEDVGPGGRVCAAAGDGRVVVFNLDGELHAMDAVCVHTGGPIEDGVVKDGIVTCPWHLHRYEISTGERVDMEGPGQAMYPVSVEEGVITVDVPDPEPPGSMRETLLKHAREWTRDP